MLSVSEMEKWDSLTKVNKGNKTDLVKRMRKRAESGVAMLNESGLWTDIKKELLEFLDLSMMILEEISLTEIYMKHIVQRNMIG